MLPALGDGGPPCVSPVACTSSPVASWSRPSWTPVPSRAGCAARSPRCTATPARSTCSPRRPAQGVALHRADHQGRRGPGPPDGPADVRGRPVRGLPSHVVSANQCCAVAAWRGAFMAHGSLTELAARARWRSPAPARRPRRPGRPGPAHSASPRSPARSAGSTGSSSRTATPSPTCSLGSARTPASCSGRSAGSAARSAPPPTAWPTSTTRTCAARRAAVAAAARVTRALDILSDEAPNHLTMAGQLRLEHRQASAGGAGRAGRPAVDEGRDRRAHKASAGLGRQARPRPGHPDTEARGDARDDG